MEGTPFEIANMGYLTAGAVGAFGNQVLYWGYILRSRTRRPKSWKNKIPFWAFTLSAFYVVTGAGVGFFCGVDLESHLLALGAGGLWPQAVKALGDVGLLIKAVSSKVALG